MSALAKLLSCSMLAAVAAASIDVAAMPGKPAAGAEAAERAAAPSSEASSAEGDPALGKRTYLERCRACHGVNLVTTTGSFDLRTFPKDERSRFFESVRNGKRAMPAWSSILSTDEIANLWAYVNAVNASRAQ